MASGALNRKTSLFLSFAPLSISLDAQIKGKLKRGKFPLTKTAWVKFVAMMVCVAALVLFVAQSWNDEVCPNKPNWYLTLFPVCMGVNIGVELVLYLIFSCGGAVNAPGKWVRADIVLNLIASLDGIVGSTMTTVGPVTCTENKSMHQVPGILGIVGSCLSIVGCAAIFLMYRSVPDEGDDYFEQTASPDVPMDYRKSMQA